MSRYTRGHMKLYAYGSRPWQDNCDIRSGRSVSHHTVKRVLAEEPVVPST